jgi:hypothetical protein
MAPRLLRSIFLILVVFSNCAVAGLESPERMLGRSIYENGIGENRREIVAIIHGGVVLKGAAVACAGCHGRDGRGSGEAFIRAPDIRWFNLSKPYLARRIGAARTPYDSTSFAGMLRSGVTAGGGAIDPAMPRFDLTNDEIQALISYLSVIGSPSLENEPRLTILGLLPAEGTNSPADEFAWKLRNCSSNLDAGYRVAAIDIIHFDDPEEAIAKLEKRIRESPNSIILAPFLLGWESRYAEASARWKVPTVLPFAFLDPPRGNNWLYRFPGVQTQIKALLKFAKDNGRYQLSVVHNPDDALSSELAVFTKKAAVQYQIATDPKKVNINAAHSARLWLTPVTEGIGKYGFNPEELILVPALFYTREKGNALALKFPSARWAISYPYALQKRDHRVQDNPINVWARAACNVLSRLGDSNVTRRFLPDFILGSGRDFYLFPDPAEKQMLEQVFIADENDAPLFIP